MPDAFCVRRVARIGAEFVLDGGLLTT